MIITNDNAKEKKKLFLAAEAAYNQARMDNLNSWLKENGGEVPGDETLNGDGLITTLTMGLGMYSIEIRPLYPFRDLGEGTGKALTIEFT